MRTRGKTGGQGGKPGDQGGGHCMPQVRDDCLDKGVLEAVQERVE